MAGIETPTTAMRIGRLPAILMRYALVGNQKRWRLIAMLALNVILANSALALDSFTLANRAAAKNVNLYGDVPLGAVIRTDERYNRGGLFQGPRGWDYWNLLPDPEPYQDPNLWPDKRPTYFFGQLVMPAGSALIIRGRFPHARYFKFNLYKFERHTFVAIPGASLAGNEIEPDPGSANPFTPGADRTVKNRNFTIRLTADEQPKDSAKKPKNTLFVGRDDKETLAGFRIYVSDDGYDGAGWGPANRPSLERAPITYTGELADGTQLSEKEVVKQFGRPLGFAPPPMTADQWYKIVYSKHNDPNLDPAAAPARPASQFELFYGLKYNIAGAFMTPEARSEIKLQTAMEGGGDPTTQYMINFISRKFGHVYVVRAKMPTFPDTYSGAKRMPSGQVAYWSVATVASPPSGELWDGIFDMMVPQDKNGYYTIVVSRPEDRPKNATRENGVIWLNWGPGEGLGDPRNRKDWGMLLMRFMVPDPGWENSPARAVKPGTAKAIMGPYYPTGYYTTKAEFEEKGPRS
jgi:hypothetical protein